MERNFGREIGRRIVALPSNTTSSGVTVDEVEKIVDDVMTEVIFPEPGDSPDDAGGQADGNNGEG